MNKYALIIGLILMTFTLKKSISNNGIDFLKFLENEKLTVYPDEADLPTVGIGHRVQPRDGLKIGDTITPMQSGIFLRRDLVNAERAINMNVKVPLNQNQYDALTSFIFNTGVDAFKNSTLLRKLNEYDYSGALKEFPRWRFVTKNGVKVESNGLIKRRKYEQDLFNA